MNYCETKVHLIDEIKENCKELNNDQLCKILQETKNCKPKTLREFIEIFFNEKHYGTARIKELYCNDTIYDAFEHEVRKICLDIGSNFKKVKKWSDNYINHFSDMLVERGVDIILYIRERGSIFNPNDLAYVIYLLYIEEITFR